MRYVCMTCGEADKWKENAPGKMPFVPPISQNNSGSSISSGETEHTASNGSHGSQTIYGAELRSRSSSMSTDTSALSGLASYAVDEMDRPQRSGSLPRGYELCAGCIEVHGISHAKASAREAKKKGRRIGEFRHSFRERIWGAEGWVDVGESHMFSAGLCPADRQTTRKMPTAPSVMRYCIPADTNVCALHRSLIPNLTSQACLVPSLTFVDLAFRRCKRYTPLMHS